jgi:shikimate kinase
VIATGGGIVIKEANRTLLKKECFVVYLSRYFWLT